MHRLQISVFGAVTIVFAVQGANEGLFVDVGSLQAMGAGWLILAVVDILWVLYFTSEDDSLALHIFNSFGTGGLTPPSRRRRSPRGNSVHMNSPGNGYAAPYSVGGGIGPGMYDAKINGNGSFHEPIEPATRSIGGGSITNGPTSIGAGSIRNESTVGSPLMGSGNAGIGAGGGNSPLNSGVPEPSPGSDGTVYKAKALYACTLSGGTFSMHLLTHARTDTGSADDPNEISFQKGELLDILDKQGKWWQAKKSDGTVGSEYSSAAETSDLTECHVYSCPFKLPTTPLRSSLTLTYELFLRLFHTIYNVVPSTHVGSSGIVSCSATPIHASLPPTHSKPSGPPLRCNVVSEYRRFSTSALTFLFPFLDVYIYLV